MSVSNIIQRRIIDLLRFVITGEKVEVGKSTVAYLKKLLPQIKEELNLDFDKFEVNPGTHPRDTADVVLFKKGLPVRKFTVKTAVSANIRSAIRRMQKEKRFDEDGLLLFGLYCVRKTIKEHILGIILIPRNVLYNEPTEAIYDAILKKVEEKKRREKLDEIAIVAMNESIILKTAATVLENQEAIEKNREAIEKNREAIEKNHKKIAALEAKVDTLHNEVKTKFKEVETKFNIIDKKIDEIKDLLAELTKKKDT